MVHSETPNSSPAAPLATPARLKVLIVDDEPDLLTVLALVLSSAGYEPTTALGPEAARDHARLFPFDLLLCDVEMPGTRGPDLAVELLAIRPSSRVLLMSGNAAEESVAFPLIRKPCSRNDLILALSAII